MWQHLAGRHMSVENPPRCWSWKLDMVKDLISTCRMTCVDLDLCMWGAKDPGNLLPYKKPMRLASNIDLTPLVNKCDRSHVHQRVEGCVCSGREKGMKRSTVSGRYPIHFLSSMGTTYAWYHLVSLWRCVTSVVSHVCEGAMGCEGAVGPVRCWIFAKPSCPQKYNHIMWLGGLCIACT